MNKHKRYKHNKDNIERTPHSKGISGIREFFANGHGKYILLFLEVVLLIAFLANPELYYYEAAPAFLDRFYADSLLICGLLWITLVLLTLIPVRLPEEANWVFTTAAGVLTPFFCFVVLEAFNDLEFWAPVSLMELRYVILDLLVYYVIFGLLLLIVNSIRGAAVGLVLMTAAFGIFNYALTTFRNMSFIASDIYSALTAANVAGSYRFHADTTTAEMIMVALTACAFLLKLRGKPLFHRRGRLIYLACCACAAVLFLNVYVFSDFLERQGVDFRVYRPQYKYRYYGTLLTTARTFGYLHVKQPPDYSTASVEEAMAFGSTEVGEANAAGPSDVTENVNKPNIICIMNESFSDPASLGDLPITEDYMPFFRSLKENTIKGYTYSSVFGGNTANSEFEFLTGNTMAFLPDNSVPYQLFLRGNTPGLVSTVKAQGYEKALALHPYYKTGYSRQKIYPLLGFDRFYTSDDFSLYADMVNYHITDEANYEKIIDLYENRDPQDGPFFMFNVTMQNHGSYTGSTAETGDSVKLTGRYSEFRDAEQFLNMMKMSDDALKGLVTYFQKVKEPTVILFFGDHMPDLDLRFYEKLLGKETDELEGEELEKLYRVPFLIWANYDIEEKEVERSSNNYLSTYLAEAAGLRKTPYLNFLTELREKVPAINALGYWDKEGHFYETNDAGAPYYEDLCRYHLIEYNNLFGGKDRISGFFYLDGEPDSSEESTGG